MINEFVNIENIIDLHIEYVFWGVEVPKAIINKITLQEIYWIFIFILEYVLEWSVHIQSKVILRC